MLVNAMVVGNLGYVVPPSHIQFGDITDFDRDFVPFGIVTAAFVLLGFLHGVGR